MHRPRRCRWSTVLMSAAFIRLNCGCSAICVSILMRAALRSWRRARRCEGTAARLHGTYTDAQGTPLVVGGKTGTGDNRFDHFAAGGGITSSRVVDRTATFVFYLGDRFYGTVTAYVPGAAAARYHFTSGL